MSNATQNKSKVLFPFFMCLGGTCTRNKKSNFVHPKSEFSPKHRNSLHCLRAKKKKNKKPKQKRLWLRRDIRHTWFDFVPIILIIWIMTVDVSLASPAGMQSVGVAVLA